MSTRPVIAHLLPWSNIGGTEWGTLRLIEAVGSDEFAHLAFVPAGATPLRELFEGRGHRTVEYEGREPGLRSGGPFLRASLRLRKLFRSHEVRLAHGADLLGAYYASLAGPLAGIPVTTQIRCRYPSILWRDRQFLRLVRHFCFVSQDARRSFGASLPVPRTSVVGEAVELDPGASAPAPDLRELLALPPGSVLIGMVSRVAPAKDFPTLLDAAAMLAHRPEICFVVIGDHDSMPSYREHHRKVRTWIEERGLGERVRLIGHLGDLRGVWRQLSASVLVTHTEGLPLVLLESMAAGCPVIATAVGGIPELVRDGENGFLHQPGNPEELARKIAQCLDKPELRSRLTARALADVRTGYSMASYGARMRGVFRRWAR